MNVQKLLWTYRRTRAIRANRRERARADLKAQRAEKLHQGYRVIQRLVLGVQPQGVRA